MHEWFHAQLDQKILDDIYWASCSLMGAYNEVDSKTVNWCDNLSGSNSDMPVTPTMMA